MSDTTRTTAVHRDEIVNIVEDKGFGIVEKPLGVWERLLDNGVVRKSIMLILLALVWEGYARWSGNPLLFPTFVATVKAFVSGILSGTLLRATWTSISLLLQGYAAGLLIAALFTAFASATRVGADLLETLTSMFNPLPSIALLPLSMIWS